MKDKILNKKLCIINKKSVIKKGTNKLKKLKSNLRMKKERLQNKENKFIIIKRKKQIKLLKHKHLIKRSNLKKNLVNY